MTELVVNETLFALQTDDLPLHLLFVIFSFFPPASFLSVGLLLNSFLVFAPEHHGLFAA